MSASPHVRVDGDVAAARARVTAALAADGFCAIDDAFSPATLARWQRAFAEQMKAREAAGRGRALPVGEGRFLIPVELEGELADPELVAPPLLWPLLQTELGGDLVLNSVSAVVAFAGARTQPLHKDHELLFGPQLTAGLPPYALTLVVPLVALTAETGTTQMYVGSHVRSSLECAAVEPFVPLGGCLLVDYRISHRGTPNLGARMRPILYVVFSRPWFVDERNFHSLPALVPSETLRRRLPPEAQAMLTRAPQLGVETVGVGG